MDRVHRVLKPLGPAPNQETLSAGFRSSNLRISCAQHVTSEKQILTVNTVKVQLFPDLSWLTLQQRRALQPLLTALCEHSIPYSWGFRFSLSVRRVGKTSNLRAPEDMRTFCTELNVPCPETPILLRHTEPWKKEQCQKPSRRMSLPAFS